MKHLNALKKAIVAGLLIGIGCTVYLNMDNSIVASFLFGLGLFTIINLELNLFTGKIGYINKSNYIEILITLIGNAIGVNVMAFLMKQTRLHSKLVEKSVPIVDNKLRHLCKFISSCCLLRDAHVHCSRNIQKAAKHSRHTCSFPVCICFYFGWI